MKRAMAIVSWWKKRRHRDWRVASAPPTDVVTGYARMLTAEREMHSSATAAKAAAGELEQLVAEKGLISQIENQSQLAAVLATTARAKADAYEAACMDFAKALVAAGLPPDWSPERASIPIEQQMRR
jgi:hypothetical protein